MIVLDTTVLVYAVGAEHPLRDPCRRLVRAVEQGAIEATTTVEVVQEFTHVRSRRRSRADAVGVASAWVELLSPLLVVSAADLRAGLTVYREADRLGAFDAVLAATARAAGAAALVSADRAFAEVGSLTHVVPDDDGLAQLLRS